MTAVAKLAVRFGRKGDALGLFRLLVRSNALDVQQRAGEFLHLFERAELCGAALAPLDALEDAPASGKATLIRAEAPLLELDEPAGSLAALLSEPGPREAARQADRVRPFPGSVEVLRRQDYVMYFEIKKNPQNPRQIAVRASVFNLGPTPFTNFAMRFGVPFGWKLQAQPPSGNILEPVGGRPITQQILLLGEADVKLRMKTQIAYQYGTQPITENGEINPIFD
jgi:hypothetical protein